MEPRVHLQGSEQQAGLCKAQLFCGLRTTQSIQGMLSKKDHYSGLGQENMKTEVKGQSPCVRSDDVLWKQRHYILVCLCARSRGLGMSAGAWPLGRGYLLSPCFPVGNQPGWTLRGGQELWEDGPGWALGGGSGYRGTSLDGHCEDTGAVDGYYGGQEL